MIPKPIAQAMNVEEGQSQVHWTTPLCAYSMLKIGEEVFMEKFKTIAIRFIFLAATLTGFCGSFPALGADHEPICGSVQKFNQTHRWQDLPGCTEKRDHSNPTSAVTLLGRAKDAFKDFFETWEKGDMDHVDSYAGGCLVYTNGADDEWNSDPELVRAKPAFDEMKRKVERYLEWQPMVSELFQRYFYAMTWLGEAKNGELDSAAMAVREAKSLQKTIAEVQQKSVPDDFLIPGSGQIPAATIGEIKTRLASYLNQADSSMTEARKIDDAKWEPYTKFLTGDRLKFFNETYRIGTNVYGRGGKYLDTPAQFDSAPVMCTRSTGHSGLVETWRVNCYSFSGDRQVGGPRTHSGYGNTAPASAFQ
jgi:hypothetical protein